MATILKVLPPTIQTLESHPGVFEGIACQDPLTLGVDFIKREWNPRYLVYARVHGHPDPDEMLAVDTKKYPGGKMCGFILWIDAKLLAFKKLCPDAFLHNNLVYHEAFDLWLQEEVA